MMVLENKRSGYYAVEFTSSPFFLTKGLLATVQWILHATFKKADIIFSVDSDQNISRQSDMSMTGT